jgi:hypothetical protein
MLGREGRAAGVVLSASRSLDIPFMIFIGILEVYNFHYGIS